MDTDDIARVRAELLSYPNSGRTVPLAALGCIERLWQVTAEAVSLAADSALTLDRLYDALLALRPILESAREEVWAIDSALCNPACYRHVPHEAARIVRSLNRGLMAEIEDILFCLPYHRRNRTFGSSSGRRDG